MERHIPGFPRIGVRRELKAALEARWRGELSPEGLAAAGRELRLRHWDIQRRAGLSLVAVGDFSFYDHVLDTALMLGAVPRRFADADPGAGPELAFRMARGDAARGVAAMEMTKWFDTNYHYIVPELEPGQRLGLASRALADDVRLALEHGHRPKAVLLGPVTFLALAKGVDGQDPWGRLDAVLDAYAALLGELDGLCPWIQVDEPVLCTDLSAQARAAFPRAYAALNGAVADSGLLLATYFGALGARGLELALASGCRGLHVDLVRGAQGLPALFDGLPGGMTLSAGVVDGRGIWRTDLRRAVGLLEDMARRIGPDRLMVASSCSLLHVPVDLEAETALDPEVRGWMAFATQKCAELGALGDLLEGRDRAGDLAASDQAVASRRQSPLTRDPQVRRRCAEVDEAMLRRARPYAERSVAQGWLDLPALPTTTIGSFPQTAEIRRQRRLLREGAVTGADYEAFLKEEIARVVRIQEELGLDVLVHGEAERNDMVEYFGQQLAGFRFTGNGWVQSYGSRCVKPPVICGDVSRPGPMTVSWITYAQSLTERPMKGMLTGPVTILCWSFVRDDLPRAEVCRQLALAVRDEVRDLEAAGVRIIQIDEAAFREGMPLAEAERGEYLRWAVECFRLATSGVDDATQIHSHMCYSSFNDILPAIAAMDADVISIESSRSGMELLQAFREFDYPNAVGPGIYDIHSPRVPPREEMVGLLRAALALIPAARLWVNPDCGLKTRAWPETVESLRNMVAAAQEVRAELEGRG